MQPLSIAFVGCGHIRTEYAQRIQNYPDLLKTAGATDLDLSRAEDFCREYGGKVFPTFDALLQNPEIDAALNLTVHHAHFDLNARAASSRRTAPDGLGARSEPCSPGGIIL